eukprot:TRINITY_DN1581_c0_g1_i11.p1 TRINITY_DN1581_c0_g1~~TRINITY_DN1581_c0_g1_i11.p1  ORF type:complete len:390 (+),score=49.60 TRINITY_DN1581_c0_g1_i11:99-1268(+)
MGELTNKMNKDCESLTFMVPAMSGEGTAATRGTAVPDVITQVKKGEEPKRQKTSTIGSFFSSMCRCLLDRGDIRRETAPPLLKLPKSDQVNFPVEVSADYQKRKLLVLDLDETLVHSSFEPVLPVDHFLEINIHGYPMSVYVRYRPKVREFLKEMSKHYEIIIFTASLAEYADPVIDALDVDKVVSHRLFRESCTQYRGTYIKDLSRLGRNLKDVIIVDNSELSFVFQPLNGVLIKSFFDDEKDRELDELTPYLRFLADVYDARPTNRWRSTLEKEEVVYYVDMSGASKSHTPEKMPLQIEIPAPAPEEAIDRLRPKTFLNSPKADPEVFLNKSYAHADPSPGRRPPKGTFVRNKSLETNSPWPIPDQTKANGMSSPQILRGGSTALAN